MVLWGRMLRLVPEGRFSCVARLGAQRCVSKKQSECLVTVGISGSPEALGVSDMCRDMYDCR